MAPKASAPQPPTPALRIDIRRRVETLECPEFYAPHQVMMRINTPDAEIADRPVEEWLPEQIEAWTFRTTDGQPVPVSYEAIKALPPDLVGWLVQEWHERRTSPLATLRSALRPAPTPPTGASNGHGSSGP